MRAPFQTIEDPVMLYRAEMVKRGYPMMGRRARALPPERVEGYFEDRERLYPRGTICGGFRRRSKPRGDT